MYYFSLIYSFSFIILRVIGLPSLNYLQLTSPAFHKISHKVYSVVSSGSLSSAEFPVERGSTIGKSLLSSSSLARFSGLDEESKLLHTPYHHPSNSLELSVNRLSIYKLLGEKSFEGQSLNKHESPVKITNITSNDGGVGEGTENESKENYFNQESGLANFSYSVFSIRSSIKLKSSIDYLSRSQFWHVDISPPFTACLV